MTGALLRHSQSTTIGPLPTTCRAARPWRLEDGGGVSRRCAHAWMQRRSSSERESGILVSAPPCKRHSPRFSCRFFMRGRSCRRVGDQLQHVDDPFSQIDAHDDCLRAHARCTRISAFCTCTHAAEAQAFGSDPRPCNRQCFLIQVAETTITILRAVFAGYSDTAERYFGTCFPAYRGSNTWSLSQPAFFAMARQPSSLPDARPARARRLRARASAAGQPGEAGARDSCGFVLVETSACDVGSLQPAPMTHLLVNVQSPCRCAPKAFACIGQWRIQLHEPLCADATFFSNIAHSDVLNRYPRRGGRKRRETTGILASVWTFRLI